jgi:FKBP-type peptidyl-prolyl cis-trans isomerase 2
MANIKKGSKVYLRDHTEIKGKVRDIGNKTAMVDWDDGTTSIHLIANLNKA